MRPTAKFLLLSVLAGSLARADDTPPDPYRALEIASATVTQTWLREQDQKTRAYFAHATSTAAWHARLAALTLPEPVAVPQPLAGPGTPLFDPRTLGLTPSPSPCVPSPDGNFVAYAVYPRHADAGELHVRCLINNKDRAEDILPWENYGDVAWSADSGGFYYLAVSTALPDAERVAQATIRYHAVGHPGLRDADVFPATRDPSRYLIPQTSDDGHWLFVSIAAGFSGTTLYARDLTASTTAFQTIFTSTAATASVSAWHGSVFLLTNAGAPHYAVWTAGKPAFSWHTLIPEASDAVLESLQIAGNHLVLTRVRNAASEMEICALTGKDCVPVMLPAAGSVDDIQARPDRDDVYFRFQSFFIPPRVMHLSIRTGRVSETSPPAQAGVVEQGRFLSKDKTPVPVWLLHAAGLRKDGARPTILAVYGGFGVSMTPQYLPGISAWIAQGGVYAIPLLRGGGEFGEAWHAAGSGRQKQNTFDDAIAAAQFLIDQRYTSAAHLAIQGASNGGLTAAAVITQRPDLFRAAVIKNPLTDMLRYPLFGEGPAWLSEYGSPQNPQEYQVLLAYSPVHHVRAGIRYPATLILSADSDDRVDPMHARKFAAALQGAALPPRPVLFETLKNSGHAGAGSTAAEINEWTDRLTFLGQELR